jgi:hypothetical protein
MQRGRERIAMHGSLPLVSASGTCNYDLSMQLWRGSLSIEDFFTPLVIEGEQEAGA